MQKTKAVERGIPDNPVVSAAAVSAETAHTLEVFRRHANAVAERNARADNEKLAAEVKSAALTADVRKYM